MIALVSNLLWALVVVYAIVTVKAVALAVLERVAPVVAGPEEIVVPDDLHALVMQENETWAQEELMRVIRERYEMYRDWNRVRTAMGLGQRADA